MTKHNQPKLHHYVPRAYLRRFSDASSRLTVRRRGQQPFTRNVAQVAAENHLYSVVLEDGTRDVSAELTLAEFDGAGNEALKELCNGKLPGPRSANREAMSLFIVLQMTRTPGFADQFMFATAAITALGGIENVSFDSMRRYLREVHLRFEPAGPEVRGAVDLVHGLNSMGLPSKHERLQMMFDAALEVAPRIGAWTWSIEKCRKAILASCDRLPVIWHPVRPSDSYQGSGILDADELWCPIDANTLLVLRKGGVERVLEVEPKRFRDVNSYMARHCYQVVFHRPTYIDRSSEFLMSPHLASLRFWEGPAIDESGQELMDASGNPRTIIHQWVPIRDDLSPD